MLENVKVVLNGRDGDIARVSTYGFTDKVDYTTKRNTLMRLVSGVDKLTDVNIYEVANGKESLIATLTPVNFDKLTGEWSIVWGEGFTPKRDFDTARCATYHKVDKVDETGKVVTESYKDEETGETKTRNVKVNESINLRVDVQESIDEVFRSLRNEPITKVSAPRETKKDLKNKLDSSETENQGLRAILVKLAKKQKIAVTESMSIEEINDLITPHE